MTASAPWSRPSDAADDRDAATAGTDDDGAAGDEQSDGRELDDRQWLGGGDYPTPGEPVESNLPAA